MGNVVKHMVNILSWYYPAFRVASARKYLSKLGDGTVDLNLDNHSGIAVLTLNNPKKRNALSGKMMVHLYNAVCTLENWSEGKAVIVEGAGDCFCSGGDLDVFKRIAADCQANEMSFFMTHTSEKLRKLPLISVSFVSGRGAFGGGAELALSTDFCVIHPTSKIGFVHATMGVTPAWGGAVRLCERIGVKQTLDILLQSNSFTAADSLDVGITDCICSSMTEVYSFLDKKLQRHHTVVIRSVKSMLIADREEQASQIFAKLLGGESNNRALAAKIKHS